MTRDITASDRSAALSCGTRRGHDQQRHQAAVANTLGWADDAAGRDDYHDALAWLRTLEAIGEVLPDHYLAKKEAWTLRAHAGAGAEAAA